MQRRSVAEVLVGLHYGRRLVAKPQGPTDYSPRGHMEGLGAPPALVPRGVFTNLRRAKWVVEREGVYILTHKGRVRVAEYAEELLLVDVYTPNVCRVWLRLEEEDLTLEWCAMGKVGQEPEWLEYESNENGWHSLCCWKNYSWDIGRGGLWRNMAQAMELGLAPGQAFCMEVRRPKYITYHMQDGREYDVNYYADFLRAIPIPPEEAATRWEEWVEHAKQVEAEYTAAKLAKEAEQNATNEMENRRMTSMQEQWDRFLKGHWQMEMPKEPGDYPVATTTARDPVSPSDTKTIYIHPLTLVATCASPADWRGWWWSEPLPKLPPPPAQPT